MLWSIIDKLPILSLDDQIVCTKLEASCINASGDVPAVLPLPAIHSNEEVSFASASGHAHAVLHYNCLPIARCSNFLIMLSVVLGSQVVFWRN